MENKKFFVHPSSYIRDYVFMTGVPHQQIGWAYECSLRLSETLICSSAREYYLDGEYLKKKL